MSDGLAILSVLQPEPPYTTAAAIGTTYSADLVACMVALSHLDAATGEDLKYRKLEALRALERLRGRVLIAGQQGRIALPKAGRSGLALLDRILHPIRFDERKHSFHPKVWVVRQVANDQADRFVLLVGSRNLTPSTAWDYGVALVGSMARPNIKGPRRLPELGRFVRHVCELAGNPSFAMQLGELDDVFWQPPDGVSDLRFDFSAGDEPPPSEYHVHSILRGEPERVLTISPFLDASMIRASASVWKNAKQKLLVACAQDLDKVAAKCPEELASLNPCFVAGAAEAAESIGSETSANPLEELPDRGLHAKVTVVEIGDGAGLLVGSPNLTERAWSGRNCEAWIALATSADSVKPLWDWAKRRARDYVPPTEAPAEAEVRESLDALRNTLAASAFTLTEPSGDEAPRLACASPPVLTGPQGTARLEVARLTDAATLVPWPKDSASVELPRCALADRTAFVVFRLTLGDEAVSWVQSVEVTPELDDERDREAVARALGPRGFLLYLRSLLGDLEVGDDEDDGADEDEDHAGRAGTKRSSLEHAIFQLEDVLRRIAHGDSPAHANGSLAEVSAAIRRYRGAVLKLDLSADDRRLIERLWSMWDAIERGMSMP